MVVENDIIETGGNFLNSYQKIKMIRLLRFEPMKAPHEHAQNEIQTDGGKVNAGPNRAVHAMVKEGPNQAQRPNRAPGEWKRSSNCTGPSIVPQVTKSTQPLASNH